MAPPMKPSGIHAEPSARRLLTALARPRCAQAGRATSLRSAARILRVKGSASPGVPGHPDRRHPCRPAGGVPAGILARVAAVPPFNSRRQANPTPCLRQPRGIQPQQTAGIQPASGEIQRPQLHSLAPNTLTRSPGGAADKTPNKRTNHPAAPLLTGLRFLLGSKG